MWGCNRSAAEWQLLSEYDDLIASSRSIAPTLIEYTALGAVLQSFYNGVENIFQTIGKRVDGQIPAGELFLVLSE